jgi:hypothetical protein
VELVCEAEGGAIDAAPPDPVGWPDPVEAPVPPVSAGWPEAPEPVVALVSCGWLEALVPEPAAALELPFEDVSTGWPDALTDCTWPLGIAELDVAIAFTAAA